jgi:hypothetical protein
MKLWQILRDGNHGEIYRAMNGVESWIGTQIQFQKAGMEEETACVVYAKPPKVRSLNASIGRCVTISGGAMLSDWEFVEVRGIIFQSAETSMSDLACHVSILLSVAIRKPSIGSNASVIFQKKSNIIETIADVILYLERECAQKFSEEDKIQTEFHANCNKVIEHLEQIQKYMHIWDDAQTIDKAEQLISLAYYMYKTWWGIESWNEKNNSILTEDEMMMIAKTIL